MIAVAFASKSVGPLTKTCKAGPLASMLKEKIGRHDEKKWNKITKILLIFISYFKNILPKIR